MIPLLLIAAARRDHLRERENARGRRALAPVSFWPVYDYTVAGVRVPLTTAVINWNHTWWRTRGHGPAPVKKPGFASRVNAVMVAPGPPTSTTPGAASWRAAILAGLSAHTWRIVGHQHVHGVNALVLASKDTTAKAPDEILVDPATHLPLRMIQAEVNIPSRHPYVIMPTDFWWLRPTPANLAQLKLKIPVGYTRVQAP